MAVNDVLRIRRHQPTRLERCAAAAFAWPVTSGTHPGSVPVTMHALRRAGPGMIHAAHGPATAFIERRDASRRAAAMLPA